MPATGRSLNFSSDLGSCRAERTVSDGIANDNASTTNLTVRLLEASFAVNTDAEQAALLREAARRIHDLEVQLDRLDGGWAGPSDPRW